MKTVDEESGKTTVNDMVNQQVDDIDHHTISRILSGSTNEYRILIEKYQVQIFNLLLQMLQSRHLAEELTQSVFIKAWESLAKFRFEYRFFSWLYRIAINMALNELKKPNRHVGLEFIENMADQSEPDIPDNQVLMTTAIHKMKTKYKMLIVLKYYQDLSYSEIAGALKISEKKVRSRLYDARLQLKEILEKTEYY